MIQFLEAHYAAIGITLLFLFKTAVNAFPPQGQPFQFGQWFMGWMREVAQEAPDKIPPLTPAQAKILGEAGQPQLVNASQPTGVPNAH